MESLNKAFISIDKTGLNPLNDKIIEIAILKINQIQIKKKDTKKGKFFNGHKRNFKKD